jgi:2-iminobutanoate/2-iminopropanoate deaminase
MTSDTTAMKVYNRRELEIPYGFSQAILAGSHLFISGCVSWDMKGNPLHPGDFNAQVEAIYADIDATLKVHGLSARAIIKETIYTRDMEGLIAANPKRLEYYKVGTPPTSTWVEIKRLVHPDLLLEVEVIAFMHC